MESSVFQLQGTLGSLYIRLYYLSVMSIISFISKLLFNFNYQPQGEAGSAEEQPASNKADAYTIAKGVGLPAPFSLLSVCPMAKKTYSPLASSRDYSFLIRIAA
jgi:hypothetical protein